MTMVTRIETDPRESLPSGRARASDPPSSTESAPAAQEPEAQAPAGAREPPQGAKSKPTPNEAFAELPKRGTRERKALDAIVKGVERLYGEEIERRVNAITMHCNEAGFDPFGFDPDVARYVLAVMTFVHRTYFRTEVTGIDRVPMGRALFVANHSGHIPIDGMLIATSLIMDREPPILARAMVEKWAQRLPFVSVLFTRVGQVLGSPDNARRLLEGEHPLLVFPEGIRGISKPFSERYKLANFGPGFMRLALETKSPIVPIAVIGGEEQYPAIANVRSLARMLGMPAFPVIPQLLLGVPLPLPTKYRLHFGEPMHFEGDPDEDDADIEARVETVREAIQAMLGRGLSERQHIFW
jgi:1-acyl-sn-glycerol-3-phosphate acyltransferase